MAPEPKSDLVRITDTDGVTRYYIVTDQKESERWTVEYEVLPDPTEQDD